MDSPDSRSACPTCGSNDPAIRQPDSVGPICMDESFHGPFHSPSDKGVERGVRLRQIIEEFGVSHGYPPSKDEVNRAAEAIEAATASDQRVKKLETAMRHAISKIERGEFERSRDISEYLRSTPEVAAMPTEHPAAGTPMYELREQIARRDDEIARLTAALHEAEKERDEAREAIADNALQDGHNARRLLDEKRAAEAKLRGADASFDNMADLCDKQKARAEAAEAKLSQAEIELEQFKQANEWLIWDAGVKTAKLEEAEK